MQRTPRALIFIVVAMLIAALAAHRLHSQAAPPQIHAAHIYNENADAKKDISGALALAQATHKNVLLDFGANWCGDCQVLDLYMHDDNNGPLLDKYYVTVHIDVGRFDKNTDVAHTFNVPLNKGIPALAVVSPGGRVIFSQTVGEFADMRHMQSGALTEFLKMWRPQPR